MPQDESTAAFTEKTLAATAREVYNLKQFKIESDNLYYWSVTKTFC